MDNFVPTTEAFNGRTMAHMQLRKAKRDQARLYWDMNNNSVTVG